MAWVRRQIDNTVVENTISLLTPFIAYLPAERLGASGVLAVVTVGLYLGRQGPRIVSPRTRIQAGGLWEMVTFLLEGLIFILIGLELPRALADVRPLSIHQLVLPAVPTCAKPAQPAPARARPGRARRTARPARCGGK